MIKEEEIASIGKFQKTHALKGELNALLDIDPEYLEERKPLIVNIDGIFVPFYAESVRPKGATSFLVKLDGVDNVDEARDFVNKEIFGLRKDLLEFFDTEEEELVFDSDLIGYEIEDKVHGLIGRVKYIDDSTMNALLIVETPGQQEIYIPYNEDFIEDIDENKKVIYTDLPEGLVYLNKK